MAAGLGFKEFTTGDVLTAADANGFLASQVVMVFDDAAARTTAINSPQEGMITYLKDTNAVEKYDGAAFVAVGGGASPLTTKGDLYTFSTVDARLPVGTDGHTLVADSVEATGLKWAAPGGGGENYSLINAGGTNLTAATSITVSGISGKKGLLIHVEAGSADALSFFELIFNSDTASNYTFLGSRSVANAAYTNYTSIDYTQIDLARQDNVGATTVDAVLQLRGCDSTGFKPFILNSGASANGTSGQNFAGSGFYKGTSAISSVTIRSNSGNFDAGKIFVFGA